MGSQLRTTVFVCYSHNDSQYLKQLQVHLKPLERTGKLEVWDDTRIAVGTLWRDEIRNSINAAQAAVLLISADFLASAFITDNELPPLLAAARERGLTIIPIHIAPSLYKETELAQFQAAMNPEKPIINMKKSERELLWSKVATEISRIVSSANIPSTDTKGLESDIVQDDLSIFSALDYLISRLGADLEENTASVAATTEMTSPVMTGFQDIDLMLLGLQRSSLYVLAAEPSAGKTALALSLVRNVAVKESRSVGFITLEMTSEQVVSRVAAIDSGVRLDDIRRPRYLSDFDWERLASSISRIAEARIFVNDKLSSSWSEIREGIRQLVCDYGCELVVIDYLQLLESGPTEDTNLRNLALSYISRGMKALARELDVPIFVLSQIDVPQHRQNGVPVLADLRHSGSLESDADVIMFISRDELHNPESERPNLADIVVAKNRIGPMGTASLYFSRQSVSFHDIPLASSIATSDESHQG
jgi:replicative DNA helicase